MNVNKFVRLDTSLARVRQAKQQGNTTQLQMENEIIKELSKKFFKFDDDGNLITKNIKGHDVPKVRFKAVLFNWKEATALFGALLKFTLEEINTAIE
ncbi:MAG: hypothetical protein COA82_03635 [Alkaliphilus sp.]|nr:MAG: hypothetical protein COA82_03635 [Alkaliphilus sp.]